MAEFCELKNTCVSPAKVPGVLYAPVSSKRIWHCESSSKVIRIYGVVSVFIKLETESEIISRCLFMSIMYSS